MIGTVGGGTGVASGAEEEVEEQPVDRGEPSGRGDEPGAEDRAARGGEMPDGGCQALTERACPAYEKDLPRRDDRGQPAQGRPQGGPRPASASKECPHVLQAGIRPKMKFPHSRPL